MPSRIRVGAPASEAESMPTSWMVLNEPLSIRTRWIPEKTGIAQATSDTERTRATSVSRSGLVSLTCSTRSSTTQIGAPTFFRVEVVQRISPQKTLTCWTMRKVARKRPAMSIRYLAVSPNSILRARPIIVREERAEGSR